MESRVSEIIANLYNSHESFVDAIEVPFESRSVDALYRRRMRLSDYFVDLTNICYLDYIYGDHSVRVPHQDEWIPILNRIRLEIEAFQDYSELLRLLEVWCEKHQSYRNLIITCGVSRQVLYSEYNNLYTSET